VMDQFTRRIIGFGVHGGIVDGVALCRVLSVSLREDGERNYFWKNHPGFGGRKCARRRASERSPLWRRQRDVISGSRSRARLPLAGPDACRSAGRGPIRRGFAHPESPVRMLRRWPVARHRATCRRSQIHGQRGRVDCGDMHSHRILRLHPSRAWVVAADTFAGFVFAGGSLGLTHIALASRRASVYLTSK